jgi:regulator of protease activity HflC (stomatin/prohibitin superfamily)
MALNLEELEACMVRAATPLLRIATAPQVGAVRDGFAKIATAISEIEAEVAAGRLDAESAKLLLEMEKDDVRTLLLACEGIEKLAIESAINAALDEVRPLVNIALGFILV